MKIHLILYPIAILTGIIVYLLLRKKIINKKQLQTIGATLLFCIMYFSVCFSSINMYGIEVFSLSANSFVHYVQIVPLISFLTFYSLYWLKYFRCKEEEESAETLKSNDSKMILIAFAASSALINLFLPPIKELWLKLVIMLGSGAFVGFIVGLLLWRNRKRKKQNEN
jgi:hypothetical protein